MSQEINIARKIIKFEGGYRLTPYYNYEDTLCIGYEEVLSNKKLAPIPELVWTEDQVDKALLVKLELATKELSTNKTLKPVWNSLSEDVDRKALLIVLWYLSKGIKKVAFMDDLCEALLAKDYSKAGDAIAYKSSLHRTLQKNLKRLSTAMQTGSVYCSYKV